jgi:hypothetical protein
MLLILLGIHLLLTAAIVYVGVYGMTYDLREHCILLDKRLSHLERKIGMSSQYSSYR